MSASDGYGPIPFQNQNPTAMLKRVAQDELYAQLLNAAMGAFGTNAQIDMVAPNGETDPTDVVAGMVVYLDPVTSTFKRGLSENSLGYFAKPAGGYQGVPPVGNAFGDGLLTIPCVACHKMVTNTYVAGEYPPNTPLTVESTPGHVNLGKLTAGTFYQDTIVGIVAGGEQENFDKAGRTVLEFFSYFLPAYSADSAQ